MNLDAIIAVGYRVNGRHAMGLTTWKNAPGGKILEPDFTVAKNRLARDSPLS